MVGVSDSIEIDDNPPRCGISPARNEFCRLEEVGRRCLMALRRRGPNAGGEPHWSGHVSSISNQTCLPSGVGALPHRLVREVTMLSPKPPRWSGWVLGVGARVDPSWTSPRMVPFT